MGWVKGNGRSRATGGAGRVAGGGWDEGDGDAGVLEDDVIV